MPEVVNLEQIISRRAREGRRRTFLCIALEVRGERQPRSRSHASHSLATCACLLPFTPNLKASKFFPEPNQSIRRERDEEFPKLASLPQSRGPVDTWIESSAATRAIRRRLIGLDGAEGAGGGGIERRMTEGEGVGWTTAGRG